MRLSFVFLLLLLAAPVPGLTLDKEELMPNPDATQVIATFAGGCFWCMEPPFAQLDGVFSVTSGYTGGRQENPSYEDVALGFTDHRESVRILFDPARIGFGELLEVFWRNIDPTDSTGQFADQGEHYRTAIFYHDDSQRRVAEESKRKMVDSGRFDGPIVTEILPATTFYPAEEYHQEYYKKNPQRYKMYRRGSGREGYLDQMWGGEEK
jgi:methionine-S-sulfoxide reductase